MIDKNARDDYLRRMYEGMRPMTDAEISDMKNRQAQLMMNAEERMRYQSGMQNFWTTDINEINCITEPPKPTFWHRLNLWLNK